MGLGIYIDIKSFYCLYISYIYKITLNLLLNLNSDLLKYEEKCYEIVFLIDPPSLTVTVISLYLK